MKNNTMVAVLLGLGLVLLGSNGIARQIPQEVLEEINQTEKYQQLYAQGAVHLSHVAQSAYTSDIALEGKLPVKVLFVSGANGQWMNAEVLDMFSKVEDALTKIAFIDDDARFSFNIKKDVLDAKQDEYDGNGGLLIIIENGAGKTLFDAAVPSVTAYAQSNHPIDEALVTSIGALKELYVESRPSVQVSAKMAKPLVDEVDETSVTLKVYSSPYSDRKGRAEFYKNDEQFLWRVGGAGGGRGLNIAVLNEYSGEVDDVKHFDTYISDQELIYTVIEEYLNSISNGRIVLAAMCDYNDLNDSVKALLVNAFGSQMVSNTEDWDPWAMITKKGASQSFIEDYEEREFSDNPLDSREFIEVEYVVDLLTSNDQTPPQGQVSINLGSEKTDRHEVAVDLSSFSDSGSGLIPGGKMKFSNDNETWSDPVDFSEEYSWPLLRGDGSKTLYVKVRDKDGNWTAVLQDSIILEGNSFSKISDTAFVSGFEDLVRMCVNDEGDLYMSYKNSENGMPALRYSSNYGSSWSDPTTTYGNNIDDCDNLGHVYSTEVDRVSGPFDVFFNRSEDYGVTWGEEDTRIDEDGSMNMDSDFSQICSDDNGNVYVLWHEASSSGGFIMMKKSHDFGKTWGDIHKFNARSRHIPSYASKTIGCNKNDVYVVYSTSDREGVLTYSNDAGETWLDQPIPLMEGDLWYDNMDINVKEDGHVYVGWEYFDKIRLQVSSDGGETWLAEPIIVNPERSLAKLYEGQIKMQSDDEGNIYFAFIGYEGTGGINYRSNEQVFLARVKDYGASVEPLVRVDTNAELPLGYIDYRSMVMGSLSVNNHGLVGVTWRYTPRYRDDNTNRKISMNYSVDYGETWLDQEVPLLRDQLNKHIGSEDFKALASDDGYFINAWVERGQTAEPLPLYADIRHLQDIDVLQPVALYLPEPGTLIDSEEVIIAYDKIEESRYIRLEVIHPTYGLLGRRHNSEGRRQAYIKRFGGVPIRNLILDGQPLLVRLSIRVNREWSVYEEHHFPTISIPQIVSPSILEMVYDDDLALQWTPGENISAYYVGFSLDPEFFPSIMRVNGTTTTFVDFQKPARYSEPAIYIYFAYETQDGRSKSRVYKYYVPYIGHSRWDSI